MKRANVWGIVAVSTVTALVAGLAAVAQGFDVVDAPPEQTAVWVMQNSAGQRYARVNAALDELDSVNAVSNPSAVVQSPAGVLLFTDGDSRFTPVDTSDPKDVEPDSANAISAPRETTDVQSNANTVAFLAAGGSVWVSRLDGGASEARQVSLSTGPSANPEEPGANSAIETDDAGTAVTAMSLSVSGKLAMFSATDSTVRIFDTGSGLLTAETVVLSPPPDAEHPLQMTWSGERWALLDPIDQRLWVQGRAEPIVIDSGLNAGALLQSATTIDSVLVIAQSDVLVTIDLDSGQPLATSPTQGFAARPAQVGSTVMAAWLTTGTAGGLAVDALSGETVSLGYAGARLESDPNPVIQVSGSRAVLNDTASGWAWTLPEGTLVTGSQDWSLLSTDPTTETDSADTANVTQPRPPVAEPDSFGVRAGSSVTLPVMLNDYDANGDVLVIDPTSLTQPGFGTIALIDQSQQLVFTVPAGATGTTSIEYRVSDGTTADGLMSESARVTLTVIPDDQNSAPEWCADFEASCVISWPSPSLAPGGTVELNTMNGWVDPQGDRVFAAGATVDSGTGRVNVSPTGRLVYQHANASLATTEVVAVTVKISDTNGATTTRILNITVTPNPTLVATPFAVVTVADEPVSIDIASHVSGGVSPATLVTAALPSGSSARVTLVSPTAFTFSSPSEGDFDVAVTVTDGVQSQASNVRVIVSAPATRPVALAPVSIFLTPGSDQLVDVFTAATNPEGRVLMLDSTLVTPSVGASLFVDVIDAARMRVRGATTDGLAGRIGTIDFTVSDGTPNSIVTATGQALVYLLPSPANQPPIAVDDSASVRVGAQIDVDVLANDLGATGSTLTVDPKSINADCAANLVFAADNLLRVLAPNQPGVYRCAYAASVVGNPSLVSTAVLTLTVLGADGNKPPLAPTLQARAEPGSSVEITVPLTELDPDGDAVWLTAVGSPTNGFAAVSGSGQSITFTSQATAIGQDSFTYSVRDARGGASTGTVRVGILTTTAEPGPITTTDYVDVTAGSDKDVTLDPTVNDIDTVGDGLTLEPDSVVPDAKPGTLPFTTALSALERVEGNKVTIRAPETPSVLTYRYSVADANGNVSVGLLVVRAVVESTPAFPQIRDTYVSFADRSRLITGIDVVTNKVSWTGGDISTLTLELWPGSDGFTASGWSILGIAPDRGALIPFSLTGTDFAGNDVVSYGFLRIPPLEAAILTLKQDVPPISVREEDSVTFNMTDLVATPAGTSIEVLSDGVEVFGARAAATCSAGDGTNVTYNAGLGAPWSDGCIVSVKLRGADTVTRLLVAVQVIPLDPEPELTDRALEISPGTPPTNTKVFDLTTMTTWIDNDDFTSLEYVIEYTGTSFDVELVGPSLTIVANDDAVPGTKEVVTVRIVNHPKTLPATIRLLVGPAPVDGPIGGFGSLSCLATDTTCTIAISALTGTYNPFTTELVFAPFGYPDVSAGNAVSCGQAVLSASDGTITATWSTGNQTVGAQCGDIPYTVLDAQGRAAVGSLNFALAGFPGAPGTLTQSAFTDSSVTLRIEPDEAGNASPSLRGFRIYQDSGSSPVLDCPVTAGDERYALECTITGLTAFEKHTFTAVPYNEVGDSAFSSTVTNSYAYRAPLFGSIDSATGVYNATLTTLATGAVSVTVTPAADEQVESYVITGDGAAGSTAVGRVVRPLAGDFSAFTVEVAADAGAGSGVTVEAVGAVAPPVGASGQSSSERRTVDVPGLPSLSRADTAAEATGGAWQVTMTADANVNGGDALEYLYLLWPSSVSAPTCTYAEATGMGWTASSPADIQSQRTADETAIFADVPSQAGYESLFCVTNGFGLDQRRGAPVGSLDDPAIGTFTYAVAATATDGAYLAEIDAGTAPNGLVAQFRDGSGAWSETFSSATFGGALNVFVRYCLESAPDTCSPGTTLVTPSTPDRTWQVRVTGWSLRNACVFDEALLIDVTGEGIGAVDAPYWQLSTDIPPIWFDASDNVYDAVWDAPLS
ncbi:MAG: hypothetical protein F2547_05000, partial [Actinobacteria bacterium]|nr:hypothetical protein [Actinomycetota bacterium]